MKRALLSIIAALMILLPLRGFAGPASVIGDEGDLVVIRGTIKTDGTILAGGSSDGTVLLVLPLQPQEVVEAHRPNPRNVL